MKVEQRFELIKKYKRCHGENDLHQQAAFKHLRNMIPDIIIGLLDPILTLLYNRRSKRRERLDIFFSPLFDDITLAHNHCVEVLSAALVKVAEIETLLSRSAQLKPGLRKRRQVAAARTQLASIRQQVQEELFATDPVRIKIDAYQSLRRRRYLKKEDAALLDAMLAYLPTQDGSFLQLSRNARIFRGQLRWAIGHQEKLYGKVCVCYGNLQLAVLT